MRNHFIRLAFVGLYLTTTSFCPGAADEPIVDAETEKVIDGALAYLAAQQVANGSWSASGKKGDYPVAMTGYILMAFLAAGNLPEEGEYKKNVNAGMQFLMESVQPDGLLRGVGGNAYMYSHGITTIALGEIYGQTNSPILRPKLERLIKVILGAQNQLGGWRYPPKPSSADISISVLQVVALRAAKNAGIDVPQQTIDDAVDFVRSCSDPGTGGFNYQPGKNQPGFARTAAAVYSLQVCGHYDDPLIKPASDYLFTHIDEQKWYTYGHNYAAPAQYMIGGEVWKRWYGEMRGSLLQSVHRQGELAFWDADANGGGLGPVYSTAIYATILAMPYHYLPLYQR